VLLLLPAHLLVLQAGANSSNRQAVAPAQLQVALVQQQMMMVGVSACSSSMA
jgi:hypothetical protein